VSWHASRASSVALAVALGCAANSLGAMPEGVNPAAQEIYPFEHFPQRHQVVVICRFEKGNIHEFGHAGRRKPRVPAPPYGSHVSRDERAGESCWVLGIKNRSLRRAHRKPHRQRGTHPVWCGWSWPQMRPPTTHQFRTVLAGFSCRVRLSSCIVSKG